MISINRMEEDVVLEQYLGTPWRWEKIVERMERRILSLEAFNNADSTDYDMLILMEAMYRRCQEAALQESVRRGKVC